MVVLPVPGGPQRIIDDRRCAAAIRRIGPSGPSRWSWPTTSSRLCGRSRSASGRGASGSRPVAWNKSVMAPGYLRTNRETPTFEAPMPDLPPPTPVGLTPYLTIRGGRGQEAIRFYARAFGAKEVFRNLADDGQRLLHARVEINGDIVMLSDDFPDMRGGGQTPAPAAF